jgi:CRISPR system Cascade subunit CasE
MTTQPLYLLHTRPEARLLAAWIARHHARHARAPADLGDALHGLLRAAFGEHVPQPYRYLDERQGLLAYTKLGPESMREHVALADQEAAQALGLSATSEQGGYNLRPFPSEWTEGKVLGFEVRVRPTVREGKTGRERDVFLHTMEQADGATLQREAVYAQWLREHLGKREGAVVEPWQGAVDLLNVHMSRYQRLDVLRRTQAVAQDSVRRGKVVSGPDVVLTGQLRVTKPPAFAHLLARGIGRHRAFGFGMLLLRPAG